MYFDNFEKSNCCGCKACEDVCPTGAICFKDDKEGFWYPYIDEEKCIHCKKCKMVCMCGCTEQTTEYDVYAGWNKKSKLRNSSSSGGIFVPLAQFVLQHGGIVVGAAYNEVFQVEHIFVDSEENLWKLQKSKYVQSDTQHVYRRVKKLLKQGILVLYSGTPCQIAAMKGFVKEEYGNLILCEVLCYGVPSPKVYKKYLEYVQETQQLKIVSIDFKDKRYGWDYYTTAIKLSNGKTICKFGGDSYKTFMHRWYSLRPVCLTCDFDVNNSFADLSLGDFYNVKKYTTAKLHKNGCSCIIARSEKGKKLLASVVDSVYLVPVSRDRFSKGEYKTEKEIDSGVRMQFYDNLNNYGYEKCVQMLERKTITEKIKSSIRAFRMRYFYFM